MENPFASTHSLDTNPFDDPHTASQFPGASNDSTARADDLDRRERELSAREQELSRKQVGHARPAGTVGFNFNHTLHRKLSERTDATTGLFVSRLNS